MIRTTSSKRLRTSPFFKHVQDVLFNLDLITIIFNFFNIVEIFNHLVKINTTYRNFLKSNPKCMRLLKELVRNDFGDILTCGFFSFNFNQPQNLIQQVYRAPLCLSPLFSKKVKIFLMR